MNKSENCLPKIIKKTFQQFTDRVAIDYDNDLVTYGELERKVENWSDEMKSQGVKGNDRVLVLVNEPVEFIAIWIALWNLKCVPIPLEIKATHNELQEAVKESQCRFIITSLEVDFSQVKILGNKEAIIQKDWYFIEIDNEDSNDSLIDPALFFYTSGTTGLPKCVVFNHYSMMENIISLVEEIKLSEEDVLMTPLSPMLPATITTALLPVFSVGAKLVIVKSLLPSKLLKKLDSKNVTVFFAVPYMYDLLLSSMNNKTKGIWGGVRLCLTSSAFMQPGLFDKFYEVTHKPIRSIYCSSEGGAITYNDSEELEKIRNSVGRPLRGVKIKIVDSQGKMKKNNEAGEIYVGGTHLATGYFNKPSLGEEVFKNGWAKTGDLGYIDQDGYLTLCGRTSETINVSGHLVNPREIEKVILEIDNVEDVVVFSKKDEQMGEYVAAKVVLGSGRNLDSDKIMDYCSVKLKKYKIPRYIEFVQEISTSRYGKKIRSFSR